MKNAKYDLVVYGGTSFVGRLLTSYLADHTSRFDKGLRWAIAGRSQSKLEEVKQSIGPSGASIGIINADAKNIEQLKSMCSQTNAVASTVGPNALLGEPLIQVCTESGTDYCDLCGEMQWIRRMIQKYESASRQSGARIVHCCGFDSIPSDMGVYFLQQNALQSWGAPATSVKMRVKSLKGGISGGTAASLVNVFKEASNDPEVREEINDPYALCTGQPPFSTRQNQVKSAEFDEDFESWISPFVMSTINESVVHRSNALSDRMYGDRFKYSEASLTGSGIKGHLKAMAVSAGQNAFLLGASIKPTRKLIEQFILPESGEGPSDKKRSDGCFNIQFCGVSATGQKLRVEVSSDNDPGYGSTSKMLGQAAISLAMDRKLKDNENQRPGGFWTPASLFDKRFIERLSDHAHLHFNLVG